MDENDTGLDPAYSLIETSNSRMDYSRHLERVCNYHSHHLHPSPYLYPLFCDTHTTHTHTHTQSSLGARLEYYYLHTHVDSPSRTNKKIFTEMLAFMPSQHRWRLNSTHSSSPLGLAAYLLKALGKWDLTVGIFVKY